MNQPKIPNFFHIGLMKTGTTSIQNVLSNDKRIQLFLYSRIINTDLFYTKKYDNIDSSKISIESDENIYRSMGNMYGLEISLNRIKNANPKAKIIVTVREQRSLLISAYKHLIRRTSYSKSFNEFLNSSEGISYLKVLNYHDLYCQILKYFPSNQIQFIFYENDLINNFYLKGIGIKPPKIVDKLILNKSENDKITAFNLKLNKMRIFRKNTFLAIVEDYFYSYALKIFSRFYKKSKSEKFKWDQSNDFIKVLEKNFSKNNMLLMSELKIDLKEFNYLT